VALISRQVGELLPKTYQLGAYTDRTDATPSWRNDGLRNFTFQARGLIDEVTSLILSISGRSPERVALNYDLFAFYPLDLFTATRPFLANKANPYCALRGMRALDATISGQRITGSNSPPLLGSSWEGLGFSNRVDGEGAGGSGVHKAGVTTVGTSRN
jgi:hypothetical protein